MPSGVPIARRPSLIPELTVAFWTVVVSGFVILGADLLWVVALGDEVRATGAVPSGIPFAVAPQSTWHNPIVVAQVFLSVVHGWGTAGLAALQVAVVAATLAMIVVDGRRLGGRDPAIAGVISLVVIGVAGSFVITRLPSLSLLPFVLAVSVMRRQHEAPSRHIWLLPPLFILWGNLHGGVLVGLAVLGAFLVASSAGGPYWRRLLIGAACACALVLTSAFLSTPAYYVSALGNEAAARGTDLWARPDPSNPLDVAMGLSVLILLVMAARRRPPVWEWLVIGGLVAGTLMAARHGVWLVLFLAPAALRDRALEAGAVPRAADGAMMKARIAIAAAAVAGVGVVLAVRAAATAPAGSDAVPAVRAVAGDRPVLADEPLAETLAQAGIEVWASNPIDAFPREVQAQFLDFLQDGVTPRSAADIEVAAVGPARARELVASGTWREVSRAQGVVVLERLS